MPTSRRLLNYKRIIERSKPEDELQWLRIPGIDKLSLPRPVVLVNGAFDLLHAGHMRIIFEARKRAATLVCALDGDEKIAQEKGIGRPILSFVERATALQYMPVDYLVEIDSAEDFKKLMKLLNPDLRVQGVDYANKPGRFPHIPKVFIRDTGIRTSEIIKRCKEVAG